MKRKLIISILIASITLCLLVYFSGYITEFYKLNSTEVKDFQLILEEVLQIDDFEPVLPKPQRVIYFEPSKSYIVSYTTKECTGCNGFAVFEKTIKNYYHFVSNSTSNYAITDLHIKLHGDSYLIMQIDNRKMNVHSFKVKYANKSKTYYPKSEIYVAIMKVEDLYKNPIYTFFDENDNNITDVVNKFFPSKMSAS